MVYEMEKKINKLEKLLEDKDSKFGNIDQEYGHLLTRYNELSIQLTNARTDLIFEKEQQLARAEKVDVKYYTKKVTSLEGDIEKMKNEIEVANGNKRTLEIEKEKIMKELQEMTKNNQFNKQHHADLQTLIEAMQGRFSKANERNEILGSKVNELETNRDHLEKEVLNHIKELNKLRKDFEKEVALRKKKDEEINVLKNKLAVLANRPKSLTQKNPGLTSTRQSMSRSSSSSTISSFQDIAHSSINKMSTKPPIHQQHLPSKKDGQWNNYGISITASPLTPSNLTSSSSGCQFLIPVACAPKSKSTSAVGHDPESRDVPGGPKNNNPVPKGLGMMFSNDDEPGEDVNWCLVQQQNKMTRSLHNIPSPGSNFTSGRLHSTVEPSRRLSSTSQRSATLSSLPQQTQDGQRSHGSIDDNSFAFSSSSRLSLGGSSSSLSNARRGTFVLNNIPETPDENRVDELKRRNTLCLPHLKSTYPLEELPVPVPEDELRRPSVASSNNPSNNDSRGAQQFVHHRNDENRDPMLSNFRRVREEDNRHRSETRRTLSGVDMYSSDRDVQRGDDDVYNKNIKSPGKRSHKSSLSGSGKKIFRSLKMKKENLKQSSNDSKKLRMQRMQPLIESGNSPAPLYYYNGPSGDHDVSTLTNSSDDSIPKKPVESSLAYDIPITPVQRLKKTMISLIKKPKNPLVDNMDV
ncbi:hypothetical protein HELRODRAFT_189650 [Helobdella robusta]|uniref:Uncharacterized protein n=1 Tax=Helobdella robusta TaxID=6412 RepID=T1FR83_HELRO|nr:hypothetical protein HELRODRAFT_189650 [Helobdella robusta]ESN93001.1 hypothetical protein HELRODRAFT_189650 [Helobdella robusta]